MGFIYFNLDLWIRQGNENKSKVNIIDMCNKHQIKNNQYVFNKYVFNEEDILPEILKDFTKKINIRNDYAIFAQKKYWNSKIDLEFSVYCIVEDIVLSYDYFLERNNVFINKGIHYLNYLLEIYEKKHLKIQNMNKDLFYFFIGDKLNSKVPLTLTCLNKQIGIQSALLSDEVISNYNELLFKSDSYKESIKKKLNSGQCCVKKEFELLLGADLKISSKNKSNEQKFLELKFLNLVYQFEKTGVPFNNFNNKKINIYDILNQYKAENVDDRLFSKIPKLSSKIPKLSSKYISLFNNEISKELSIDKLYNIHNKFETLDKFFRNKTEYILTLCESDKLQLSYEFIKNELCVIKTKLDILEEKFDSIQSRPSNVDNIFEITYSYIQKYYRLCKLKTSYNSLEFINKEIPAKIPLAKKIPRSKMCLCINKLELENFISNNTSLIAELIKFDENDIVEEKWICDKYNLISNLLDILVNFNTRNKDDLVDLTVLISMIQAIREVEQEGYNYENNYKYYAGNKNSSLLSKLKKTNTNGEDTFYYVWVAFIKRWFHFNEGHYDVWKLAIECEKKLENISKNILINLNNIKDFHDIMKFTDVILKFPIKEIAVDYNTELVNLIYNNTQYKLIINSLSLLGFMDENNFKEKFIKDILFYIDFSEYNTTNNIKFYQFYIYKIKISVKQNIKDKVFEIVNFQIKVEDKMMKYIKNIGLDIEELDYFYL